MKTKEVKDYKLPYSVEKGKENDLEHVREIFVKNMNHSEELRKDLWIKLYGKKFMSKNHKKQIVDACESEWRSYKEDEKHRWFDFVTDKNISFITDIMMITQLVKENKGNMRKVWSQLRTYGDEKKKNG